MAGGAAEGCGGVRWARLDEAVWSPEVEESDDEEGAKDSDEEEGEADDAEGGLGREGGQSVVRGPSVKCSAPW